MRLVILLAIACSSSPPPPPPSAHVPPPPRAYTGDPVRGPCHAVDECKLRSMCECKCEAVVSTAPPDVPCEESCPDHHVCDGYSLICDLPSQTCNAIPN